MAKKKYPLYELKKGGNDNFVDAIAIVDHGAIESNFYMFANQIKKQYFITDEPKKMIAGLVMIPDLHIYRVNSMNEEFEVFFSRETIEQLRNDFMKNKRNDAINFMHVDNAIPENVYIVESFIVETDLQAKDLKQRFNIDSPLGSWFVQLHCESLELFQSIKQYGFHGFSIQGAFEDVLIHLNNSNNNNNIMNKIIEKFKAALIEMEAELAEAPMDKIAETGQAIKVGKEGEPVAIVEANPGDPMGQPVETPCPDGQYVLESGDTIEVKNGALVSRIAMAKPEEKPAEPAEEKPAEPQAPASGDTKTEKPAEELKLAAEVPVEVPAEVPAEVPVEVVDPTPEVSAKTLGELIDTSKDGQYEISVSVMGGKITEANVSAEQELIKEQFATAVSTIETQKKEIELLKAQLKLPVTKPIINPDAPKKFSKEELSKMTPYERNAIARGFRIIK
jgi:hypothetical protein